jgi:hypothetical protein
MDSLRRRVAVEHRRRSVAAVISACTWTPCSTAAPLRGRCPPASVADLELAICLELAMVDLPVAGDRARRPPELGVSSVAANRFPVPPPGLRGRRRPSCPSPPTRRRGSCLAGARKERGGAPVRHRRWGRGGADGARGKGDEERPCPRLEGPLGGRRVAAGLGTGARAAAADLTSRVVRITQKLNVSPSVTPLLSTSVISLRRRHHNEKKSAGVPPPRPRALTVKKNN